MDITKDNIDNLNAEVVIKLSEEDYRSNVEEVLRDYQKKARLNGFRPGKVPMGVIQKMYGESVLASEVNKVLSKSLYEYLHENKIEILGTPLPKPKEADKINWKNQKDFEFTYEMGLSPDIAIKLTNEKISKHVVANADESEPGTFKDRLIMENDPFAVIEAMTIAGVTTGSERGWIYVRGEYPLATHRLNHAIERARASGYLGSRISGSEYSFDIEVRRGAGAYICGEETALFNSIEGRRGEPRNKPPFPTTSGLFGEPTVINNPETLINVLEILNGGVDAYRSLGTERSPGTKLFCLSGHIQFPGLYEVPFGVSLGELLEMAGGVVGDLQAILMGGAAGRFVGPEKLDLPLTLEDAAANETTLGSGALMVFSNDVNMLDITRRLAQFFRDESCGQCVPCRIGTVRQHEVLLQINKEGPDRAQRELLDDISAVMSDASICGLGHTAASAIQSALDLGLLPLGAS